MGGQARHLLADLLDDGLIAALIPQASELTLLVGIFAAKLVEPGRSGVF